MQSPTLAQRRAAHFNATAVHASFGDVELAQITLRGGRAACTHACSMPEDSQRSPCPCWPCCIRPMTEQGL